MCASLKAANGCIHTHVNVDIDIDIDICDTYSKRCGDEGKPSLADFI